ncbi:hypothetical protein HUT16_26010 [Kitasatospora sp. NA04385]|uniref:hypothetical protein n=1 Tax=Kitasatospora sp. NA04385 TaxID=2742135 RepID=UPI001590BAAB|nr:hypothetical protein [Kitasatospora sp. NA04385]QKW22061.1 hypothetical protein HUT16_26010 [Kitasatospora sp. NA04385]
MPAPPPPVAFRFTVRPGQGAPSGFDLCDLAFTGPEGSVTSVGHTPDQGMMLVLAVPGLLDEVRALLARRHGTAVFRPADSPFRLCFTLHRGLVTTTAPDRRRLGTTTTAVLAHALLTAAESFAADLLPTLPADDPARHDLPLSLAAFRARHP